MWFSQVNGMRLPKTTQLSEVEQHARGRSDYMHGHAILWILERVTGANQPAVVAPIQPDSVSMNLGDLYKERCTGAICPLTGCSMVSLFLEEIDNSSWPFASCHLGKLLFLKYLDWTTETIKVLSLQPCSLHRRGSKYNAYFQSQQRSTVNCIV